MSRLSIKDIDNAANYFLQRFGNEARKHDVWMVVLVNHETVNLSSYEKDKIIASIWRKINILRGRKNNDNQPN